MRSKIRSTKPDTGFTLVEVLVVVAVVAILCAMTMGTMSRLQTGSQNSKCLANLRSTGAGALAYFADRNGELFPTKFWYAASWEAKPGMRDYLGITSREKSNSKVYEIDTVLTCPHLKTLRPAAFPSFLNRTYSMNYYLNMQDPSSEYNQDESTRPPLAGAPIRITNVPKLSAMWMFTDGGATTPSSAFQTDVRPGHENQYLFFPHSKRQNVVFMDGHVESLTLEQWKNPSSRKEFWGNLNASD